MAPQIAIVGAGPSGLGLAALLETKGVKDYVVFERSAKETPPRGGPLDLHVGSGQRVIKDIGAFDLLKKHGRWGGSTLHVLCNQKLDKVFEFGEGRDAPEVDRSDIRKILLSVIPDEKVRWSAGVDSATRDENGKIVLQLSDGTVASGFKLVVGADGCWSKIRHLVHSAKPQYSGGLGVTTEISPSNPHYSAAKSLIGDSNVVILGGGNVIWSSPESSGTYRLELIIKTDEEFPTGTEIDLTDFEANKRFFLQDKYFGSFAPEVREAIKHSEGNWRTWKFYNMPVDCFNWAHKADVTVIGDAAHVTTPWVGDGVNCAMRDSLILARTLKEFGVTAEAVAEYEKEMFTWGTDLISRALKSGDLFLHDDNPKSLVDFFTTSFDKLVGTTDYV